MTSPVAPWALGGESLVGLARGGRRPWRAAARGLEPLPGPCLVAARPLHGSPVGPYLELAVGEPARLGLRPGWCFTTMVVDSCRGPARRAPQLGVPEGARPASCGRRRRRAGAALGRPRHRGAGPAGPVRRCRCLVPVRALQRRADGPVVVPGRWRGSAAWPGHRRGAARRPARPDRRRATGLHVAGLRLSSAPPATRPAWPPRCGPPCGPPSPARLTAPALEPLRYLAAPGD